MNTGLFEHSGSMEAGDLMNSYISINCSKKICAISWLVSFMEEKRSQFYVA
jgi:hypothetical protein